LAIAAGLTDHVWDLLELSAGRDWAQMKHSIFSDQEVEQVRQRHEARKQKQFWSPTDVQSASEDMDNILAGLQRTNGMVEHLQQEFASFTQAWESLFQHSSPS